MYLRSEKVAQEVAHDGVYRLGSTGVTRYERIISARSSGW
jgi:hypothetical protein